MKINPLKLIVIISICFSAILSESCGKKDDPTPTPPAPKKPTSSNPQYTPKDGAGVLTAIQTVTYVNYAGFTTEVPIGLGVAVFTNNGFAAFVDGGTVSLNSNDLKKQTNNSYVYTPSSTSATGIDLTSGIVWNVSGNTTNSVPVISRTVGRSMPGMSDIDNSGTVSTSGSFTLQTLSGISNADSIYFTIAGPNKTVQKVVAGYIHSVTFTSDEMASLGKGSNAGFLQIAPYNVESRPYSGKTYYFVQEKVDTKTITLN